MKQPAPLRFLAAHWRQLLICFGFLGSSWLLGSWRLGTLVPNFSHGEISYSQSASSAGQLIDNPLYAPHKVIVYILWHFYHVSPVTLRAVSAMAGFLVVLALYLLMNSWHSRRTALITALLLGTSSWFLSLERSGEPLIMGTWGIAVLLYGGWQLYHKEPPYILTLCWIIAFTACLYIPGMLWLLGIGAFFAIRRKKAFLRYLTPTQLTAAGTVAAVLTAPLLQAVIRFPHLLLRLLMIPEHIPQMKEFITNIASTVAMLTIRGPIEPLYNVARMPKLDFAATVLAILGSYYYLQRFRLRRVWLLSLIMLSGLLFGGLAGANAFSTAYLLVPAYVFVAGGISVLLQRWLTVFPRNPIARFIGVGSIVALAVIMSVYHLDRYFLSWPHTDATVNAYKTSAGK